MRAVAGASEDLLRRTGWLLWSFHLVALVTAGVVAIAAPTSPLAPDGRSALLAGAYFALMVFSFPSVGLLIVRRQPRNRMGWLLLLGVGMAVSLPSLLQSYATLGLDLDPVLPGSVVAGSLILGSWVWPIGAIAVFVVLLFPDGRLPAPGWRWLPPFALTTMTVIAMVITLAASRVTIGAGGPANPLQVPWVSSAFTTFLQVSLPLFTASIVAAAVALVRRFRRARGTERQQLKWLAEAGALVAVGYLFTTVAQFFKPGPFSGPDPAWLSLLQNLSVTLFGLIPLAIGIALLRHRLYDIDRIVNRTAVYALLTAALLATYLGSVLVFRLVLGPLVGSSDLAVAASTLAVAALFRPVRSRVQRAVDRRFYRRRYDAVRSAEAFAGRLRQEVDLDAVSTDLSEVVRETMQPQHVSLWLRSAP